MGKMTRRNFLRTSFGATAAAMFAQTGLTRSWPRGRNFRPW